MRLNCNRYAHVNDESPDSQQLLPLPMYINCRLQMCNYSFRNRTDFGNDLMATLNSGIKQRLLQMTVGTVWPIERDSYLVKVECNRELNFNINDCIVWIHVPCNP